MILGTGIDIIEINRIQKAVERWGHNFLNHVFTTVEIENAKKFNFPYPHYAGRFAAKEAIFKAMGIPDLSWHDVAIINDTEGKPLCHYQNKLLNFKHRLLISISHSHDYAIASAIVEE